MHEIALADPTDFAGWRRAARRLAATGVPPEQVRWRVDGDQPSMFAEAVLPPEAEEGATPLAVPRRFVELAEEAILHKDAARFALLYRLLTRITGGGERHLLQVATDPDVARAEQMRREVRRAAHKMKAFLRFKAVADEDGAEHYLAWFEPEHHILEHVAPFFVGRFTALRWSIVTPERSAHWDGTACTFGPGGSRAAVPAEDGLDEAWRAYYAAIFNPARLNLRAMRREMPKKYWHGLPEARLIGPLAAEAGPRAAEMVGRGPTVPPARKGRVLSLPHRRHREAAAATAAAVATAGPAVGARYASLAEAEESASFCRDCPLWARGTRTVFGEGPADAAIMLVGEQPGDQEDLAGRPFVGPAGKVLDKALAEAGLDRPALYLTNAVKHFKYALRGKRRLHQSPDAGEVQLCRQWLDAERELIKPSLIVALGVTAATSLLGRPVTLGLERGRVMAFDATSRILVTAHPSFILRIPDPAAQGLEYRRLVNDLLLARPYLRGSGLGAAAEPDAAVASAASTARSRGRRAMSAIG